MKAITMVRFVNYDDMARDIYECFGFAEDKIRFVLRRHNHGVARLMPQGNWDSWELAEKLMGLFHKLSNFGWSPRKFWSKKPLEQIEICFGGFESVALTITRETDVHWLAEELPGVRDRALEEHRQKMKALLAELDEKLTLELRNEAAWEKFCEKNAQNDYAMATMRYARLWGKLMQARMRACGLPLSWLASDAMHDADVDGLTGFQVTYATGVLVQTWRHGDALREWHEQRRRRN